ncbi:hypothetical protein SAMN05443428_11054 [Caloramator quimbayensis]|uniref:Uncharacterized protein n=1 Tax=Caloramator quimbayensis TaxID=1147123 RepID=A0A1T4XL36_9CLOT|nr:hypothetical protein [Caloramator quimbayensis]SKA90214.1 hypothetical protein SAMN05443428_11054 [Caloramator quimbayensis]
MKKNLPILLGILFGLFLSTLSAYSFEEKSSSKTAAINNNSIKETVSEPVAMTRLTYTAKIAAENQTAAKESTSENKNVSAKAKSTVSKTKTSTTKVSSNKLKPVTKGEVLDWWKSARYTFRIGDVAKVTDIKTGKTFKIKRTMGSNHADCEALTSKDTQIIKSIWGGFTWDVRPVIISVRGRNLVASMSAMPHAGVDAAPAYKVVSNRSGGYSRGENLDVVKNNGMNGHFDVHFLNSTRHKDGKEDARHQAAIAWAAKRK